MSSQRKWEKQNVRNEFPIQQQQKRTAQHKNCIRDRFIACFARKKNTHTHEDENNIPSEFKGIFTKVISGFTLRISQNQHLSNLKMHYGSHIGVKANVQNSSERWSIPTVLLLFHRISNENFHWINKFDILEKSKTNSLYWPASDMYLCNEQRISIDFFVEMTWSALTLQMLFVSACLVVPSLSDWKENSSGKIDFTFADVWFFD